MKSAASAAQADPARDQEDFSLVLGGPLYQLMRRAHLSDDALSLVKRRIVVLALICWLPLLVLAAIGGQLLGVTRPCPSCSMRRCTSGFLLRCRS